MDKRQTFFQLVKYELLMESPLDLSPSDVQEFLKKFDESIQQRLFQNYLSRCLEEAMENPLLLTAQQFLLYWIDLQQQSNDDFSHSKESHGESSHTLLAEFESKKLNLLRSRSQSKLKLTFPICISDDEHSYYLVGEVGCTNFGYLYYARLNSMNGQSILVAIMHANVGKKQQELENQSSHFLKLGYNVLKLDTHKILLFMNTLDSDALVILRHFKPIHQQQGGGTNVRGSEYYRIKKRESRQRQREREMQRRKLAAMEAASATATQ